MPEETPTLTPPEAPIPAEAPAEAVTPETPEPATEKPAEGAEESVEPTVTPWAATPDVDDLFEIEEVKTVHQKGVREAHDTAYQELQGHMQPAIQANKQTLDQISTATESIMTTLNRAAEDGALDKRAVEDLMRTHRTEFAALNQQYQTTGYWEGVKQYIAALMGADASTFTARMEKMQQNVPDPTLATDMQKKLQAQGHKEGYDEGFKKGLKEGKAAQATQQQVKTAPAGANLEPGAAAGGATDLNKARQDYADGKTDQYPG